jgi:Ca2+-transporting ATPase
VTPEPGLVRRILRSLGDPLVVVLLCAFALTLLTRDVADAVVIAIVVVINTSIGVRQEVQAARAVRSLSALVATRAWVVRSGQATQVPTSDVVPGDLVRLRQGDLVPADAVLVEGAALQVDESVLTGEALPVDKEVGPDPGPEAGQAPGAAPASRLRSGTVVVHGRGLGRVTATGAASSVGRIASLMAAASPATPLQRRMATLSSQLAVAAIVLSSAVLILGVLRHEPFEAMVLTAVALVVAAVPESLPLVVTISLALAARRMATRHAVVRDLAAVETLGSVTVLATDKTGTLTRGSMTVAETWVPEGVARDVLFRGLALCSDAAIDEDTGRAHADPTEDALLRAVASSGTDATAVHASFPRIAEEPFDSVRKRMSTTHRGPGGRVVTWHKGAPEAVLAGHWLAEPAGLLAAARQRADDWARRGRRVIAVAAEGDACFPPGQHPRLVGLVALEDPVRETSRATVAACRAAGIRVILVTGDHPATAAVVAADVGIGEGGPAVDLSDAAVQVDRHLAEDGSVLARATPADKHALVRALQASGQVVAMTGDGVNDAPALRQADIGVAMGVRGTEVARQAADLVLTDDELSTVVRAIAEGRRVYANIRRFLTYGLSGGGSEVLIMLTGPLVGASLPLQPAQILWLNLLTHSFAGAGLAAQPADHSVLGRGPRDPHDGPLAGGLGWRTAVLAAFLTLCGLAAIALSAQEADQTGALLTLGAGQLGVAWGLRTARGPDRGHRLRSDPLLPLLLLAAAMLASAALLGPLRALLGTVAVGPMTWLVALGAGVAAYTVTRLLRARSG